MKKNILLIILSFVSTFTFAQFTVQGKIAGISRDSVTLTDINGNVLAATTISRGVFSANIANSQAGLFVAQFGNGVSVLFYSNCENIKIGGYMDIDHPKTEDLTVEGSVSNEQYQQFAKTIADEKKRYERNLSEKCRDSKDEAEHDEWITLSNDSHNYMARYAKAVIEKIAVPELAAAVAYSARGTYYENGDLLYQTLSEAGKNSMCGVALANVLKAQLKYANGEPAPDFSLVDNCGKKMSLSDFKGKIVVVDFWASWCDPCRTEMVSLRSNYKLFKESDVVFISVSMDDSKEKWLKAEKEENIPWVSLWESAGFKNSKLRSDYNFKTIPFVIVVDKNGNLAGKDLRRKNLQNKLNELLKK